MSRSWSAALLGLTLIAAAVHFVDNALRLDLYPGPDWLTRDAVFVAWMVLFVLACVVWRIGTRSALIAYGLLGFTGLLHYLAPHHVAMPIRCTLTIGAECITSAVLIAYAALHFERSAKVLEPA